MHGMAVWMCNAWRAGKGQPFPMHVRRMPAWLSVHRIRGCGVKGQPYAGPWAPAAVDRLPSSSSMTWLASTTSGPPLSLPLRISLLLWAAAVAGFIVFVLHEEKKWRGDGPCDFDPNWPR